MIRLVLAAVLALSLCPLLGCRVEKVPEGEEPPVVTPTVPEQPPVSAAEDAQPAETDESPAEPTPQAAYVCPLAPEPVTVDGVLDDLSWEGVPSLPAFTLVGSVQAATTETRAALTWTAERLYVAVQGEDTDLFAGAHSHDEQLTEGDAVLVVLKPDASKPAFYEIQVNPAKCTAEFRFASRGGGGPERWKSWNPALEVGVALDGTLNGYRDTDRGWTLELGVPLEALQPAPEAGSTWSLAVCRWDYSVNLEDAELSSCARLTVADPHHYEDFLPLQFAGAGE